MHKETKRFLDMSTESFLVIVLSVGGALASISFWKFSQADSSAGKAE